MSNKYLKLFKASGLLEVIFIIYLLEMIAQKGYND
jgi:hypothetical protein